MLITITALRGLRHIPSSAIKYYGRLKSLPEDVYACVQKKILRGDTSTPRPLNAFTSDDGRDVDFIEINRLLLVAQLLNVHEQDLRRTIYSKTVWRDAISRRIASRHFWRYLEVRKRRMVGFWSRSLNLSTVV